MPRPPARCSRLISELVREDGAHGARREPRSGVDRGRRPRRPRPRRPGERRAALGRRQRRRDRRRPRRLAAPAGGPAARRGHRAARSRRLEPDGVVVSAVGETVAAPLSRPAAAATPAVRGELVLEARSLRRSFGSTTPFERLSASFAAGRLYAVTGPSGSGKTTLLHLLAGLDLPDDGDVLLDGVSLGGLDRAGRAELRRTSLAFVGQSVSLVPFLGARENVELALALRGADPAGVSSRVAAPSPRSGSRSMRSGPSASCRPASASVSPSHVRSPHVRVRSSPTSRPPASTARTRSPSARCSPTWRASGETTVICATHDPLLIEQADEELSLGSE